MTLEGHACASGAGTIINAIATWKGAAFGIDLKTFAKVELSESEIRDFWFNRRDA